MQNLDNLVTVSDYNGGGYKPLVDFESWRVAVLRYLDELLPHRLETVECHLETDEVFILVEGRCIMFLADVEGGEITRLNAVDMQPKKFYNVKKGVYHTHTLTEDAHVIIVENQDTGNHNSKKIKLSQAQIDEIVQRTAELW